MNVKIKISLVVSTLLMFIASTAYAEYYIVYSGGGMEYVSTGGCCKKSCHHKHYKKHKKHKTYYKKKSHATVKRYAVWPTCGGSFVAPGCGGTVKWVPNTPKCYDCERSFYVPPQYVDRYYTTDYYYSYGPDFDQRTSDDF